jgi:hypothetical protein
LIPQLYSNPILNPRPIDWTNPVLPGRAQLDAIGMGGAPEATAVVPDAGFAFEEPAVVAEPVEVAPVVPVPTPVPAAVPADAALTREELVHQLGALRALSDPRWPTAPWETDLPGAVPAPVVVPVAEPAIVPAGAASPAASVVADATRAVTSRTAVEIMTDYVDNAYVDLNSELRFGARPLTAQSQKMVRGLDSIIQAQEPLSQPITVYRGGYDAFQARPGMQFLDRGYVSTSLNPAVGESFTENGAIFEIHLPVGFRGVSPTATMSDQSAVAVASGEGEFILPRDVGMKVLSVGKDVINGRPVTRIVLEATAW